MNWRPVLVAVLYGVISIAITFFNKAVLSVYAFKYSNIMTLWQMCFSLVFLLGMRKLKMVKFEPRLTWKMCKEVWPLAFNFMAMVITGLAALRLLNVPMFR
jgi:solute carrier family 35